MSLEGKTHSKVAHDAHSTQQRRRDLRLVLQDNEALLDSVQVLDMGSIFRLQQ